MTGGGSEQQVKLGVMGLGKLGLPLLAAAAGRGFDVVGYDTFVARVEALRGGTFAAEPEAAALAREHADRIEYTADSARLAAADVVFVVVPTPSDASGGFSTEAVETALSRLGGCIRDTVGYRLVVVVSTVLPGSMERLQSVLEVASGRVCGGDLGLCYSPAFIALGSVVHDFLHPDFVLIGESDERAGALLASVYRRVVGEDAVLRRMNFVNAELAKIAVNTFVTMKISFGNTLARLCERLPGADADVVAKAVGSDGRIGSRYLKGALAYGGPCFPRDNQAFAAVAGRVGMGARLAEATDTVNREQTAWLAEFLVARAPEGATIAILGLSYKPDTDVVDESPGVALAAALVEHAGLQVVVSDPAALANARAILGDRVRYAGSAGEAAESADVVVIVTAWRQFREELSDAVLTPRGGGRKTVVDAWRLLAGRALPSGVEYVPLGKYCAR